MAEARILYVATDAGLVQLANPGRSDRWREVGRALEEQPVRVVAAAPNDPLLIVAATADAVHRTVDGGFSWEPIRQGEATALAFDDDGTLYVGTQNGVLLSSVDGEQWAEVLRADQVTTATDVNPAHPSAKHVPNVAIRHVVAAGTLVVCCTAAHVYNVDRATGVQKARYAIGENNILGNNIAVLADAAAHEALVVGTTGTTPEAYTGAAVLLSGNEPVLLVGTQGALLRSVDGAAVVPDQAKGAAYADINLDQLALAEVDGPQHVSALVTPPRFLDQVFATTRDGGLWFSSDRGRTWAALRMDLPSANDLAFARAR